MMRKLSEHLIEFELGGTSQYSHIVVDVYRIVTTRKRRLCSVKPGACGYEVMIEYHNGQFTTKLTDTEYNELLQLL